MAATADSTLERRERWNHVRGYIRGRVKSIMQEFKAPLVLGFVALWFSAWTLFSTSIFGQTTELSKNIEQSLDDLSIPPVLSPIMMNPNWTIAYWIGTDVKSKDCETADEFMDKRAISETVTRRGSSRTYYLVDYAESCRARVQREISRVDRYTRKWCAYRNTQPRLEILCREWEQNRSADIARMQEIDGTTLARYSKFK